MSRFHRSHFTLKFAGEMTGPRTAADTLCEPAQSKCMSRFHKSHFIQKFTGKMQWPRMSPERLVRACAVETHVKISQEPLYTELYRKNDADQNRTPHFVPACAVYIEIDGKNDGAQNRGPRFVHKISQEPFYTEIFSKNARAQSEHRPLLLA